MIYEMSLAVSDLVLERGNGARGKGVAFGVHPKSETPS